MAKKQTTKKSPKTSKNQANDAEQLNETGHRKEDDRRIEDIPVSCDRRKVKRRRQIDPTTCEREYNDSEIEFMQAMDEYKRASGRMFPTCSEILEVMLKLGYRQVAEPGDFYQAETSDDIEDSDPTTMEEELEAI